MTRTGPSARWPDMDRCPISKLTRAQAHLLASLSLLGHDPHSYRMWNGIYRSLRIRGLVDRNLRLTDDGRTALAQCKFFSPLFTASLINQSTWHEGVAPRHHRHGRRAKSCAGPGPTIAHLLPTQRCLYPRDRQRRAIIAPPPARQQRP